MTKTLTVRDEIYNRLVAMKRKNETFSELLERLVEGTASLESLMRLRGSVEYRDKRKVLAEIQELRTQRKV